MGDTEVGKEGAGHGVDPEGDCARYFSELKVIDDEAGLGSVVDEEAELAGVDVELHMSPGVDLEVDVGLINAGRFGAEAVPGEFGLRGVLAGVVALQLVFAAPVSGAEVDVLEFLVAVLDVEGEA